jgi:DNA phosphorothioation-dependent restriction protein DptG
MIKVRDLDGNSINWNINGCFQNASAKSSYHLAARKLIKEIYPTMHVLEEVPVYIRKNEIVYLDFYIPLIKKCIEVHGEQHYKFVPHFHGSLMDFAKAKKRDLEKKQWCEINSFSFIELPYNSQDNWKDLIDEIS